MGTDFQDIIGGWRSTLAFKAPCRCGSTSNITLSGFQTIDGVTPVATDTNLRILVMGQTDATTNGIYVMQASLWLRDQDMDGAGDIVQGTQIPVAEGNANQGMWQVTSADPILIGGNTPSA